MANAGSFSKDNQPAKRGRPKGSRNKATQQAKDLQAAITLRYLSGDDPNVDFYRDFCALDAKERIDVALKMQKDWMQEEGPDATAIANITVNVHEGVQPTPVEEDHPLEVDESSEDDEEPVE